MSSCVFISRCWICRPSIERPHRRFSVSASRDLSVIDWIRDNGGFVASSVAVEHSPTDGWFLKSQTPISKQSLLISLPKSCQILNDDPDLVGMVQKVPEEFWTAKLSLKVLLERIKGERSSYFPYFQTLPIGLPGVPIFFSPTAVKALEYPPLIQQINKRCKWLLSVSEKDREQLLILGGSTSAIPDTDQLGWALAIVSSRAFRLEEDLESMLPMIDICNHSFHPNCKVQLSDTVQGNVDLIAIEDVKDGSPLMLNYGDLGNDELLLDYGFFIKGNPFDCINLNFTPEAIYSARDFGERIPKDPANDGPELRQWKEQMLKRLDLVGEDADVSVKIRRSGEFVDPRLIAGSRVLLTNEILKDIPLDEFYLAEGRFDRELNLLTMRTIGRLMFLALGQFSETIEADVTSLSETSFQDPNHQMAIQFRMEKKHLLVEAIKYIGKRILSFEV